MSLDERRLVVRQFYEESFVNLYEAVVYERCCDFSPSYQRIASLQLLNKSVSVGFDCVAIERIPPNIPDTVADAFARHFWYSQWTLSHLFLIKIPVDGQDTFFFVVVGFCDDGWENNADFIEMFSEQGELIGATGFSYDDKAVKWSEKQFTNQDYIDIRGTAPPPWSGDVPNDVSYYEPLESEEILKENLSCLSFETLYYHEPLWSEEILWHSAVEIENEGAVIRYVLPKRTYGH